MCFSQLSRQCPHTPPHSRTAAGHGAALANASSCFLKLRGQSWGSQPHARVRGSSESTAAPDPAPHTDTVCLRSLGPVPARDPHTGPLPAQGQCSTTRTQGTEILSSGNGAAAAQKLAPPISAQPPTCENHSLAHASQTHDVPQDGAVPYLDSVGPGLCSETERAVGVRLHGGQRLVLVLR